MKHAIRNGTFVLFATIGSAAPVSAPAGNHPCERANKALLVSTCRKAESEFWLRVAQCLSEPGASVVQGIKDAARDWRSAEATAQAVFQARAQACALLGHVLYQPHIDPLEFTAPVGNPWYPLLPGRTLVREKHTAEGLERIETSVLEGTVDVGGVECRTVREYETVDGELTEDTLNWVAVRQDHTVWYFGEQALEYEDGFLERFDGSWRFGDKGALPGILVPGHPVVGDVYRQEFLLGNAEDMARVVRLDDTVTVPAGTFEHCLVIEEWDPLEPFEFFLSFIAPGVGLVLEIDQTTGERSELVEIR